MEEEKTIRVDEDIPPAGMPCLVCRSLGHFCQANRYVTDGEEGICASCHEQKNCSQVKATKHDDDGESEMITDALRESILSSPDSETDASVAHRTGISIHYVARVRDSVKGISREMCVADRCTNYALKGYSYCPIAHHDQLRTEQHNQMVAQRRLAVKIGKPRKTLEAPVVRTVCQPAEVVQKTGNNHRVTTKKDLVNASPVNPIDAVLLMVQQKIKKLQKLATILEELRDDVSDQ